ncbi:MAG: Eco57I restriction-modification methylase domain-containing protein [Bryobacterales bacterium]|nr:Eco57I restriction-modification methylase domain-containing protein [Bryobacterales bacterium]
MSQATINDLNAVDRVRLEANERLDPERKAAFGQFMTPGRVAGFMAGLFTRRNGAVRLLDAGAGVGSLTAAFIGRWGTEALSITAFEVDSALASYLRETLTRCKVLDAASIVESDFIRAAVYLLKLGRPGPGFTHAILNPPYKKINTGSEHRALLRTVGLETVNLYTAFVGLALELLEKDGEMVAIIPRSFCNGPYYRPFRRWMLEKASIDHLHLFHSRTSAFHDDGVLQENIIVKLVRGKKQGKVTVTTASNSSFSDLETHVYGFAEIVHPGDEERFIHIPMAPAHSGIASVPLARSPLGEIGLEVSTGPVVDFRLKQFLRDEPASDTAPLLYPVHFSGGALQWPRRSKKPNAIVNNAVTRKWLYPSGYYTVVRRFSSKEEPRRIVANVVDPAAFETGEMGFENHLNVFHSGKAGLSKSVAHGLMAYLNSTAVDDYFRRFSGHTQVNATDLRGLKYPERAELEELGRWAQQHPHPSQNQIDEQVVALHARRKQDR